MARSFVDTYVICGLEFGATITIAAHAFNDRSDSGCHAERKQLREPRHVQDVHQVACRGVGLGASLRSGSGAKFLRTGGHRYR